MRIPKTIEILGKKWRIAYKWNLRLDDTPCNGLCDMECRTIFLDRALAKVDRPQVFMHELLHAIIFEAKLGGAESFSDEVEEILVETVSSYLLDKFTIRLKSKR